MLAGAAALALTGTAFAGQAHPTLSGKVSSNAKHVIVMPHRNASVLYDQSSGSNGVGIVSQEFTDFTSGAYDADGADDFTLPAGKHTITEVDANGVYFNGYGPADSFNVTFYKKIKKGQGKILASCPNSPYTDVNGTGSVAIDVSSCGVKAKGGKKSMWVSVQAVMAFGSGGEWGWNTNNTVNGSASVWENAGGGFGTGCSTYTTTTTCIPSGEGGDFAFAILGN